MIIGYNEGSNLWLVPAKLTTAETSIKVSLLFILTRFLQNWMYYLSLKKFECP